MSERSKERQRIRRLATAVARRAKRVTGGKQVQFDLNPALLAEIDKLVESGLYGGTREDVLVYLLMRAVDDRYARLKP